MTSFSATRPFEKLAAPSFFDGREEYSRQFGSFVADTGAVYLPECDTFVAIGDNLFLRGLFFDDRAGQGRRVAVASFSQDHVTGKYTFQTFARDFFRFPFQSK